MSPSVLIRPPLVWLIAAEAVIVVVLGLATWHVWHARLAPAAPATSGQAVAPQPAPGAVATPPPLPGALPTPRTPGAGPTPGIRTDPDFLSRQMNEINRVEKMFADVEWRVTKAAVDAIQFYIERVVLPAVERSERGGQ